MYSRRAWPGLPVNHRHIMDINIQSALQEYCTIGTQWPSKYKDLYAAVLSLFAICCKQCIICRCLQVYTI